MMFDINEATIECEICMRDERDEQVEEFVSLDNLFTNDGYLERGIESSKTINSDWYYQQLMRLQQEVEKKQPELINRKGVVFHHYNARPRTYLATRQILRQFGLEIKSGPLTRRARSYTSTSVSDSRAFAIKCDQRATNYCGPVAPNASITARPRNDRGS
ncbi:Histone-lysine N-methyltransferase SETMAR [Eumeta japonica]|uniref:Histone-lysine N-methyltransferase SETMAR n=1 Tax=Eumeta variegata TaxID=151549 RepID=A0A4C1ZST7_EUMVA|nr:Histone-lysine N-methyltransferase SETMAR [Eumeta japonica]